MRFSDLWHWRGTIDRRTYVLVGLIGFALKHNLDRVIASRAFHQPWGIFNYWIPVTEPTSLGHLTADQRAFLLTMVAMALPFVWVGTTMTLKRLRAIQLPLWWVIFFFVPLVNLLFFLVLSILPSRSGPSDEPARQPPGSWLDKVIPQNRVGSAAMALILTCILGIAIALPSIGLLSYGWGIFVGLPFCLGLIASLLYGYRERQTWRSCVMASRSGMNLDACALRLSRIRRR